LGSAGRRPAVFGGPPDTSAHHFLSPTSAPGLLSDEVFGAPPKTARGPRALPAPTVSFRPKRWNVTFAKQHNASTIQRGNVLTI